MIMTIKSYVEYNIKILLKDKISLLWSISLPTIMMLINYKHIDNILDLRGYWAYIVISSFVFGVGIHAMNLRNSGILRTIFSINNSSISFFLGNLITQIIYSLICLIVFNFFASILLKFPYIKTFFLSLVTLLASLPLAFLSFNLTNFNKIKVSTASTILNILMFALLFIASTNNPINIINPVYIISNIYFMINNNYLVIYILISTLIIIFSSFSIMSFTPVSGEYR